MSQIENDPGPVPPPTEQDRLIANRLRVIAALYAMVRWLTEHPDAPTPHTITMIARPPQGVPYSSPDGPRVAALDRFAETHAADRYAIEQHEYAKVRLGEQDSHGAEITYTVSTTRTDQPQAAE